MIKTAVKQLHQVTWTITTTPGLPATSVDSERTDTVDVGPSMARGRTLEESIQRICAIRYLGTVEAAPHVRIITDRPVVATEGW